ncbi:MAG: hypothetical protein UT41_C0001G0401 [Candidatus Wolfebacteria bacterium GW2011_GWC2_39_22]|uniref:Uncharacterized protein n=1 Tax=Candidatus Wolfebacteria bacterium GW2011_GWC2_39_22 TaxID=1619013 RepID=A0A0G0RGR9_9BACT|nr:MAG: hypothetical protein UT41_C0001G0401 [Candidatus Wolfebacteria bacterium GW2011_GWC2_39_22]HBI25482.1 hypothetical protein [Candidatus Wolfebacteria bacterium]
MSSLSKEKKVFGMAVLPTLFRELRDVSHQEAILASIFDALFWQIRLTLLDPHSIRRIGITRFHSDEAQYRVMERPNSENTSSLRLATISIQWTNVNKNSYEGVDPLICDRLPDRGMMPPGPMFMAKGLVIEGDADFVNFLYTSFLTFPSEEYGGLDLLALLKQLARERLVDQPHAGISLQIPVARFYDITP